MCVLDVMERVIFAKDVYTSIASRFNFVFIFVYAHFPDLLTDFHPLHDVLRSQLPNLRQSTPLLAISCHAATYPGGILVLHVVYRK